MMTADPRIIELDHDGKRCYQVVAADGHAHDLTELQALSRATGPGGRWFAFILMDESPLRDHGHPEDGHAVDLGGPAETFACSGVPIVLANDPSLRIGLLSSLTRQDPGTLPETEGHCLIGVAQLNDSPLARAVWDAIDTGVLDSPCAVFTGELATGRAAWGELRQINMVPRRDNGCRAARMLSWWQDPKPGEVDLASWKERA